MYKSPIVAPAHETRPCRAISSQPAPRVIIGSVQPIPADLRRQIAGKVQVVRSATSLADMLRQAEALRPES